MSNPHVHTNYEKELQLIKERLDRIETKLFKTYLRTASPYDLGAQMRVKK